MNKCIYCNRSKKDGIQINESDIIPDALTNSKIRIKSVCSKDHNSKFSDDFEYYIIENLSFLRNKFNIKGKNDYIPNYISTIKINDLEYKVKSNKKNQRIGRKKISDISRSVLLGPLDQIKSMNKHNKNIEILDLNNIIIEEKYKFDLSIFNCEKMYRLVCKIAYEWYCRVNNISEKLDIFDDIIKYITTGESGNIVVNEVLNMDIYNFMEDRVSLGSHFLLYFVNDKDELEVYFSLFGIIIYRVILGKSEFFKKQKEKIYYQEFVIDGDKKIITTEEIEGYDNYIINLFKRKIEISYKFELTPFVLDLIEKLRKLNYEKNLEELFKILQNNIKKIVNSTLITIDNLKRIVNEFEFENKININWNNIKGENLLFVYIIYMIGKNNFKELDKKNLNQIIYENINDIKNGVKFSNDSDDKFFKEEILCDKDYEKYILLGSKIVNNYK